MGCCDLGVACFLTRQPRPSEQFRGQDANSHVLDLQDLGNNVGFFGYDMLAGLLDDLLGDLLSDLLADLLGDPFRWSLQQRGPRSRILDLARILNLMGSSGLPLLLHRGKIEC